ncbi:MAG: hypothetical protein ACJAYB_000064 [Psychromonas sp.]|jgi:hypothetical protein
MSKSGKNYIKKAASYEITKFKNRKSKIKSKRKMKNKIKNQNPMPVPKFCRHCGGPVNLVDRFVVFGGQSNEWPWIYRCEPCDSHVRCHVWTYIPIGTMAKAKLRATRAKCKVPFTALCKLIGAGRAYKRLAVLMEIKEVDCHFAWFEAEDCYKARDFSLALLTGNRVILDK